MVLKGKIASSSAAGDNNNKSSSSSSSSGSKKDLKRSSTISAIPKHHDHDHDQLRRTPKRTCSSNSTSTISSGVKNTGPTCRSRKKAAATTTTEVSASRPKLKPIKLKIDVDFDEQFDKQGEEDEVFWLSSGSMSPLYKFYDDFNRLSSPWDLLYFDERLICDPVSNPASSKGGGCVGGGGGLGSGPSSLLGNAIFSLFDGSRVNPLEEASLALHEEAFDDGGSMTGNDTCSSSFLSGGSDEAACVISVVPLIDLDREEDADMWILSSGMKTSDLDDDFPSPTFNESNYGARAAAAAVCKGERCYESSDHNNDTSSSSIRSSKHDRAAGSVSIRIHLNSNAKKKNAYPFRRRKHVVVSGSLSALKLIEFKRGHHKNNAAASPRTTAKRPLRFGRKSAQHHLLPSILENDVQVLLLNEECVPSSLDVFVRRCHHKADDDHVFTSSPMQNTSTALTCYNTDSSPFWDFNRTGMWVSLINLEKEDSKWISSSSKWDDHDLEESNMSSPTQKNTLGSEPNSSELFSETTEWDSMDCDNDEPLFWPLDKSTASDWRLALDYFCLSPRKAGTDRNNIKFGSSSSSVSEDANADSDLNISGSVRFRLHHQRRLNIKSEGSKRKLVLVSSLNASKMVDFKRGRARKNNVVASKSKIKALSSSIDDSSATISCGFQYLKLWTIGGKERSMIARDPIGRGQMLLEEDYLCFKDHQLSIESIVGLDEFDGHEGMDHMEFSNINEGHDLF